MQDFPKDNTPSYKMCHAINQGMYEVCLSEKLEREIAYKMMKMLLKYGDNFERCSNEMRNMFWHYTREIELDLQAAIAQIEQGPRLGMLWHQVVRLIYEGFKPYEALKQVCQQLVRIIQELEPDHCMIVRMESMCSLLLIWIDFHHPKSMLPGNS